MNKVLTKQQSADTVPVPTNADQAALMVLLGEAWLRGHAPERLRAPQSPAEPNLAKGEIDLYNDINRVNGNTMTALAHHLWTLGYRKAAPAEPPQASGLTDKQIKRHIGAALGYDWVHIELISKTELWIAARAILDLAAATKGAEAMTDDVAFWQKRAEELGFQYIRSSSSANQWVECTPEQAAVLLREVLNSVVIVYYEHI